MALARTVKLFFTLTDDDHDPIVTRAQRLFRALQPICVARGYRLIMTDGDEKYNDVFGFMTDCSWQQLDLAMWQTKTQSVKGWLLDLNECEDLLRIQYEAQWTASRE